MDGREWALNDIRGKGGYYRLLDGRFVDIYSSVLLYLPDDGLRMRFLPGTPAAEAGLVEAMRCTDGYASRCCVTVTDDGASCRSVDPCDADGLSDDRFRVLLRAVENDEYELCKL